MTVAAPPTSEQSGRPDVSIIVVSYNTKTETLACLKSVLAETPTLGYELLVVDNASPDGSAVAIAAECPSARLFALDHNLGFARANNYAARVARGRYLLLLNPDTIVLDRAIERLHAVADAQPEAGIWGGRTLFGNLTLDPTSCWRRMTAWSLFCRAAGLSGAFPNSRLCNGEAYPGWDRSSAREVDIITGCFLLIRTDLWQRLDGFDPVFFMYGEEADLCLRAKALGARPMLTPAATIIHLGGVSERTRAGKMIKLLAAKATLAKRTFAPWSLPLAFLSLKLWPLSRWLAHAALARMERGARHAEEAASWRKIWQARARWQRGFPEPAAAVPVPAPVASTQP